MGDLSQSPGVVLCQKKCQNEKEIKKEKKVDLISLICAKKEGWVALVLQCQ